MTLYHTQARQLAWWEIRQIDAVAANDLLKVLKPMVDCETQLTELLHTLIDDQHNQLIAAGERNKIMAVAALRRSRDGVVCCFFNVRAEFRRRGIGGYLLACLFEWVLSQGQTQLCMDLVGMESDEQGGVLPYLKSYGFQPEPKNMMRWVKQLK